jgi:hypothetical protein
MCRDPADAVAVNSARSVRRSRSREDKQDFVPGPWREAPHGGELQSASERPPGGSHATARAAQGAELSWPREEGLGRRGGLGPHCVFYFLSYFLFFSPLFSFKFEFQLWIHVCEVLIQAKCLKQYELNFSSFIFILSYLLSVFSSPFPILGFPLRFKFYFFGI